MSKQHNNLLLKPLFISRGKNDQHRLPTGIHRGTLLRAVRLRSGDILFQDDMRVDAAEAERTDACPARQDAAVAIVNRCPWLSFVHDVKWAALQLDIGIQRFAMQALDQG